LELDRVEEQESQNQSQDHKASPKVKKMILIILLGIVVLSALAIAGMHFTSQPNFCFSCHEIRAQVTSWSISPHKNVTCLNCHSNPGTVGYVSRKLKGLNEVYFHVTGQIPTPIVAKFNTQTCIYCHTGNLSKKYPNAKNIKLTSGPLAPKSPHEDILAYNTSCLICHRNMGHNKQGQ
jgi:cytochrome c nitrite reductase small subunit